MPRAKYGKPLSVANYLVKIGSIDYLFTKCEGGEVEFKSGEYSDASDRTVKKVRSGMRMVSDLTLSAPYNPTDFAPIEALLRDMDSGTVQDVAISVQPIDNSSQQLPIGQPRNYQGCQLLKITYPNVDLAGSDAAEVKIVFAPDSLGQTLAA